MTRKKAATKPPPPCDPETLTDTPCTGKCGRVMHKVQVGGDGRSCTAGHPRHSGRGLCPACYRAAKLDGSLGDFAGAQHRRAAEKEKLLDEWAWVRGDASFEGFGARMGVTQSTWNAYYMEAADVGDPRARGKFGPAAVPSARLRLPGVRR